ncbi:MAG: hypothetical protein KGQ41_04085 [Alphaproteobacteria bacterium]|nr:hypothetical protein [Alphaproteobacteria bacterium]
MTRYAIEYWLLRAALGVFGMMTPDAASGAGGALFKTIGPVMGISKTARKNLRLCFPDWTEAHVESTIKGMWENLGRVVGEYPHLEAISKSDRVTFRNPAVFEGLRGKPVIFVSGHLGNWEVLPPALLFRQQVTMHSVYRAPNNPKVDALLLTLRAFGARLRSFGKNRRGLAETLRALQEGASVGMLIDQKMNTGIEVPFFGHPAMTSTAFVELAKKLGCPAIPGRIVRTGGCRFEIEIYEPLAIEGRDTAAIVADMHAHLESWIKEQPEQWLWLHRRWKKAD